MTVDKLPPEFEVVLIDDAMAPIAPRGTKVRFRTGSNPAPGDAVLVVDEDNTLYFRVYHAGVESQWEARPSNAYHATLKSAERKLRVLAVFVGLEAAWSQISR